jgi:hypothetical protein
LLFHTTKILNFSGLAKLSEQFFPCVRHYSRLWSRLPETASCAWHPGIKVDQEYVHKDETLAKLIVNNESKEDTVCVYSPFSGIVYPYGMLHEKEYINKGDILFVLVDSVKKKITAKAFVSYELRNRISVGMPVESNINNTAFQGKITSISKYANPNDGTYTIILEFVIPYKNVNNVIYNTHSNAKIKLTERTVFESLFQGKITN